ncbi:DUF1648 domain-containing protein [Parasphingorhabdus pacifica]
MTFRKTFLLVAGLWVVLVSAVHLAIPLLLSDRLPDPIAMHWGPSGEPDGAGSLWLVTGLGLVLWLALAGGGMLATRAPKRTARYAWPVAALLFGSLFSVGITASTVWANLDAGSWQQARSLGWQVLLVSVVAIAAGFAGAFLCNRFVADSSDDVPAPVMTLRPGQRAVWVSATSNSGMLAPGLGFLLVGLVLLGFAVVGSGLGPWLSGSVFVFGGLAVLLFSAVRVQVDEAGVAIAFGPLRWPVRRVALSRIDTARSEERRPAAVGGWGYRGLPGSATIMVRSGECLILRYAGGGELGISVDDAERGAGLINALVAEDRV